MQDFSPIVRRALKARGIVIVGAGPIPDFTKSAPFADAPRGFDVIDNGTRKNGLTYTDVCKFMLDRVPA